MDGIPKKQEYDFDGTFDSWKEKMGLNEELNERGGKLRPTDKLRRKRKHWVNRKRLKFEEEEEEQ